MPRKTKNSRKAPPASSLAGLPLPTTAAAAAAGSAGSAAGADQKGGSNELSAAVSSVLNTPSVANKGGAKVPHSDPTGKHKDRKHSEPAVGSDLLTSLQAAAAEDGPNDADDDDMPVPTQLADASDSDDATDKKSGSSAVSLMKAKLAPHVIESVRRTGQTFSAYAESKSFLRPRNRMEAIRFAQCIDAYLNAEPPLPLDSEVLELMCRAFLAVNEADRHRNWTLADALALYPTSGTMLPRHLELQLLTDANKLDRANKYAHKANSLGYKGFGANGGARRLFDNRAYGGSYGDNAAGATAAQQQPFRQSWNQKGRNGAGKPFAKAGGAGANP